MTVLVVVFTAVALGLSAASLLVSLIARRDAQLALRAANTLAGPPRTGPRRPPEAGQPAAPERFVERRDENFGPPPGETDRRRHRAPDTETRARRRDADTVDDRYAKLRANTPEEPPANAEPVTAAIPAAVPDQPATEAHPAPTSMYRRPPPPLPRPGTIGRDQ